MPRQLWLALIVTLLLIAGALTFWLGRAESPPGPPTKITRPTDAQLRQLQAQADTACQCARQAGNSDCWAEFDRNIARFEFSDSESMCEDESETFVCFGSNRPGEQCIKKQRAYLACSDDEARQRIAEARAQSQPGCSGS